MNGQTILRMVKDAQDHAIQHNNRVDIHSVSTPEYCSVVLAFTNHKTNQHERTVVYRTNEDGDWYIALTVPRKATSMKTIDVEIIISSRSNKNITVTDSQHRKWHLPRGENVALSPRTHWTFEVDDEQNVISRTQTSDGTSGELLENLKRYQKRMRTPPTEFGVIIHPTQATPCRIRDG